MVSVETAAVADKNKESKKQRFRICISVKLVDGSLSSCLTYNIVSLGKMAGKTEPFHEVSWIWTLSC